MSEQLQETVYVLLPGATQEQEWAWCDVERLCSEGSISPDTLVFSAAREEWVPVDATELKRFFTKDVSSVEEMGPGGADDEDVAAEYETVLKRLHADAGDVASWVEAGCLAADLKDRAAARDHFQHALELRPFNERVAIEVRKRFGRRECESLAFLNRPPSPWDDLGPTASAPFRGGGRAAVLPLLTIVIAAAISNSPAVVGGVSVIWAAIAAWGAAGGNNDPLSAIARSKGRSRGLGSAAAAGVGAAEWIASGYGFVRLLMVVLDHDGSVAAFVSTSPIVAVGLAFLAFGVAPVVVLEAVGGRWSGFGAGVPWVALAGAVRIGGEFAPAVAASLVVGFACGGVWIALAGWPIIASLALGTIAWYGASFVGWSLGRVAARNPDGSWRRQ